MTPCCANYLTHGFTGSTCLDRHCPCHGSAKERVDAVAIFAASTLAHSIAKGEEQARAKQRLEIAREMAVALAPNLTNLSPAAFADRVYQITDALLERAR